MLNQFFPKIEEEVVKSTFEELEVPEENEEVVEAEIVKSTIEEIEESPESFSSEGEEISEPSSNSNSSPSSREKTESISTESADKFRGSPYLSSDYRAHLNRQIQKPLKQLVTEYPSIKFFEQFRSILNFYSNDVKDSSNIEKMRPIFKSMRNTAILTVMCLKLCNKLAPLLKDNKHKINEELRAFVETGQLFKKQKRSSFVQFLRSPLKMQALYEILGKYLSDGEKLSAKKLARKTIMSFSKWKAKNSKGSIAPNTAPSTKSGEPTRFSAGYRKYLHDDLHELLDVNIQTFAKIKHQGTELLGKIKTALTFKLNQQIDPPTINSAETLFRFKKQKESTLLLLEIVQLCVELIKNKSEDLSVLENKIFIESDFFQRNISSFQEFLSYSGQIEIFKTFLDNICQTNNVKVYPSKHKVLSFQEWKESTQKEDNASMLQITTTKTTTKTKTKTRTTTTTKTTTTTTMAEIIPSDIPQTAIMEKSSNSTISTMNRQAPLYNYEPFPIPGLSPVIPQLNSIPAGIPIRPNPTYPPVFTPLHQKKGIKRAFEAPTFNSLHATERKGAFRPVMPRILTPTQSNMTSSTAVEDNETQDKLSTQAENPAKRMKF